MYLGDLTVDATVTFHWNTNEATGASVTRATNGTVKLIRDDNQDCTAGAITDSEDSPDVGIHKCAVDTSGNVNCIAGYDYTVWLDGATIDGEVVNAALASFSIENRSLTAKIGTPVQLDSGTTTIAGMLTKLADDSDGGSFDAETDSQRAIRSAIVAAADAVYPPDDSSGRIDGTEQNGTTYADAISPGGDSWTIQLVSPGNANIHVVCEFNMGANRLATQVDITGYFDAGATRACQVYAYNYLNTIWDKLSSPSPTDEMRHSPLPREYTFPLNGAHTDKVTTPGEVKIRFFTDGDAIDEDDLYLDYVRITGIAVGGTTPGAVAAAVWDHDISGSLGGNTAAYALHHTRVLVTDVSAAPEPSTTVFGIDDGVAEDDAYNGMIIMVEDVTDDHYEVRRIKDYTSAGVVAVDRALSFIPADGDDVYILATGYGGGLDTIEAAVVDLYHADVFLTVDGGNSRDEYTVQWYKNGVPVTASITNPALSVISRNGATLIDDETMTELGTTEAYIWNESTNRLTAGDAALALVSATIDASTRNWRVPVGRDIK